MIGGHLEKVGERRVLYMVGHGGGTLPYTAESVCQSDVLLLFLADTSRSGSTLDQRRERMKTPALISALQAGGPRKNPQASSRRECSRRCPPYIVKVVTLPELPRKAPVHMPRLTA